MEINYSVINNYEKTIFALRSLYKTYGFSQFKMSKFEEYELYARNKEYLVSDNIITFTDTDGKLMALKPDVTLSIIKNNDTKDGGVQKVFYNENVYRVSKSTNSYKEIMQVGLECIGDIDTYNVFEVIMLAAKSLESISDEYVLDISNMDILLNLINSLDANDKIKNDIIKAVSDKNTHDIIRICKENEINNANCDKIVKLISLHGDPETIISNIKQILGDKCEDEVKSTEEIISFAKKNGFADKLRIDFSVVDNANYYNGFVFKGYINGISSWVLSGGQYDKLMKKMKLKNKAIGFAVYLDLLEDVYVNDNVYDVDSVVVYNADADIFKVNDAVTELSKGGSVLAVKKLPTDIKYKSLYRLCESGVELIENNA